MVGRLWLQRGNPTSSAQPTPSLALLTLRPPLFPCPPLLCTGPNSRHPTAACTDQQRLCDNMTETCIPLRGACHSNQISWRPRHVVPAWTRTTFHDDVALPTLIMGALCRVMWQIRTKNMVPPGYLALVISLPSAFCRGRSATTSSSPWYKKNTKHNGRMHSRSALCVLFCARLSTPTHTPLCSPTRFVKHPSARFPGPLMWTHCAAAVARALHAVHAKVMEATTCGELSDYIARSHRCGIAHGWSCGCERGGPTRRPLSYQLIYMTRPRHL